MQRGHVKIFRSILDNPVWSRPIEFRLFFILICNAVFSFKGYHNKHISIRRGQYLRSYRNLQKDLQYRENNSIKEYSLSTIKRAISYLVREGMIIVEETLDGTLFTIVNYNKYQKRQTTKTKNNQCLQGLKENPDRLDTGPETPPSSRSTNNDMRISGLKDEHDTGLDSTAKHQRNNNKNVKNVKETYSPNSDEFGL